jgi:1-acyl-sn-glycerol-3-phosphate acyltransferase
MSAIMPEPASVFDRPANDTGGPDLMSLADEAARRAFGRKEAAAMPTVRQILARRLPYMGLADRVGTKLLMLLVRRKVVSITGLEHVLTVRPFILALNHSTRREALVVPTVLIFHRGGALIHFWSDWMFRLIPGLAFVLRRSGTIVVPTKRSRYRAANLLKPLFQPSEPALEQARTHLAARRAIGVFPEGTVNRNPERLLPGRHGAARLSLEMGVPVVPVGIRFPGHDGGGAIIPEGAAMEIHIGAPLVPPRAAGRRASLTEVSAWHAEIMSAIAMLSGKTWQPRRGAPSASRPDAPTADAA